MLTLQAVIVKCGLALGDVVTVDMSSHISPSAGLLICLQLAHWSRTRRAGFYESKGHTSNNEWNYSNIINCQDCKETERIFRNTEVMSPSPPTAGPHLIPRWQRANSIQWGGPTLWFKAPEKSSEWIIRLSFLFPSQEWTFMLNMYTVTEIFKTLTSPYYNLGNSFWRLWCCICSFALNNTELPEKENKYRCLI